MPTLVHFDSGNEITLNESFDKVHQQLVQQSAGLFSTPFHPVDRRIQVFAANIDYIEELPEELPED